MVRGDMLVGMRRGFRRASRSSEPAGSAGASPDSPGEDVGRGTPRRAGGDRLAGYRLVRRIASGDRADVYLAAVADPGAATTATVAGPEHRGLVALRVYEHDADPSAITVEVEAMALVAALPALLDLATLDDRRTCVVVERLSGPTLAGLANGPGLSAGQAVTILAPLAVAVRELERHGFAHVRLALSDVMLDDTGRARVIGTGALRRLEGVEDPAGRTALVREMLTAFTRLVREVGTFTHPAGVLDPVGQLLDEVLETRPFRVRTDEIERMLFAIAEPAPLAAGPVASVHGEAARRHRAPDRATPLGALEGERGTDGNAPGSHLATPPTGRWGPSALAASIGSFDSLIGETVLEGSESDGASKAGASLQLIRSKIGAACAARRPVLIVGGLMGAGALVLALTMLPPGGGPRATRDDGAGSPTTAAAMAAPDDTAETVESPPVPLATDAATAAAELLGRRERCFDTLEPACLDALVQAGSALDQADRALMAAAQADRPGEPRPGYAFDGARIVGEMGGAALVEVPYTVPEREPASILVMRSEAGWRLREIFG